MGIGLDAIYIAGNMFTDDSSSYSHIRAFAVDKNDLYAGTPLSVAEASLGGLFFTGQPVKLHGYTSGGWPDPGTPHHIISHDAGGKQSHLALGRSVRLGPCHLRDDRGGEFPRRAPDRSRTGRHVQ